MIEINNQTAQTGKKILDVASNAKDLDLRTGISLGSLEQNVAVKNKALNKDNVKENLNLLPLQKNSKIRGKEELQKEQDTKAKIAESIIEATKKDNIVAKDNNERKAGLSQKTISVAKATNEKKQGYIKKTASVAKKENDKAKAQIRNMVAKEEKQKKEEQKAQEHESLIQSLKKQQASKETAEKSTKTQAPSKVHDTIEDVADKAKALAKTGSIMIAKEAIKQVKAKTIDQGTPVEQDRG